MIRIFLLLLAMLLLPMGLRAADLPSRDPHRVLPLLARISEGDNLRKIDLILGRPDSSVVSGFYIYSYHLSDATTVYVATADRHRVFGVQRSAPGENAVTCYNPISRLLMHPAPGSAPY